jgi:hypothetical protein
LEVRSAFYPSEHEKPGADLREIACQKVSVPYSPRVVSN